LTISAVITGVAILIATLEAWTGYSISFLFLPLFLWAGFRAGARAVTLAATAIIVIAILATAYGVGPFAEAANESILLLEGFIAGIPFAGLIGVGVRPQQLGRRRPSKLIIGCWSSALLSESPKSRTRAGSWLRRASASRSSWPA